MMLPENDAIVATGRRTGQRRRWYKPARCSICASFIWFRFYALKETDEAPEPRQEWLLCKSCLKALQKEMSRSSLRSPVRLRIAMGLVAAERSPRAYLSEQRAFQREFTWMVWALILFALFHAVIFLIIFAAPR